MTLRAVVIARALQLPAAAAVQFTSPVSTTTIIKQAVFTNTDTTAVHKITVHIVPAGAALSNATMLINGQYLAPGPGQGAVYVSPELAGQVLLAGDTLRCFADAGSKVTLTVSGIQQT